MCSQVEWKSIYDMKFSGQWLEDRFEIIEDQVLLDWLHGDDWLKGSGSFIAFMINISECSSDSIVSKMCH